MTVAENLAFPLEVRNIGKSERETKVMRALDMVQMGDFGGRRPAQLSGGQQQRVACARALVTRPDLIFADEPTGNLDSRSGAEVLGLLRRSVDEYGQTVVMVTHDANAASYADRVLFLSDGRIVDELSAPTPETVAERMVHLDPSHEA
jgi:putative ABC transport system ATP-binding protein